MPRRQPRQGGRSGGVDRPGRRPPVRGLRGVHGGVGRRVEHHVVVAPRPALEGVGVGQVELGPGHAHGAGEGGGQRSAQLTVGAQHQRRPHRHRRDVGQGGGGAVLVGQLPLVHRDRPVDRQRGIGVVDCDVRRVGAPVVVDQVGVRRRIGERLVAVADPAGHEDGDPGHEVDGERRTEAVARAQVDPRAVRRAGDDRDQLVPRLGVQPAGGAALRVPRDVRLHRPEVRQAEAGHLGALPRLLEPAALVLAAVETDDEETRDRGALDRQVGHHWPFAAYAASVTCLWGAHQSRWSVYQATVSARPCSKSPNRGCQSSSRRSLPASIA